MPEISEEYIRKFLCHYNIEKLIAFERLEGGWDNLNLLVETEQGEFVIRQYRVTAEMDIHFELDLIDYLVANGFPTPKLLRNKREERLTPYNGKPAALFDYVQGRHIEQPNAYHLEAVGQLLGKLHVAIADFVPNQPRNREVYLPINQFLDLKKEQACQVLGLDYLLKDIQTFMTKVNPRIEGVRKSIPTGVIHHDVNPANVLFNENDEIVSLLDFDESCVAAFIADIAVLLHYWALNRLTYDIDFARAKQLLHGYEQVRPLTAVEASVFDEFFLLIHIAGTAEHILGNIKDSHHHYDVEWCNTYRYYRTAYKRFLNGTLNLSAPLNFDSN